MSTIRKEVVRAALNRSYNLIDYNIHNDFHKQHEFRKQTILADESLTEDVKLKTIRRSTKCMDYYKLFRNEGTKRRCHAISPPSPKSETMSIVAQPNRN